MRHRLPLLPAIALAATFCRLRQPHREGRGRAHGTARRLRSRQQHADHARGGGRPAASGCASAWPTTTRSPAPPRRAPSSRCAYGDGVAYYMQAGCCDQLDPLVDARGVLLCYPSGGFTGRGDGKCPGALPPAAGRREVWRHR